MIADIHELIVCEATSTDWTDLRIEDYDITDAVLSVIGEDPNGEAIAAFASEPGVFHEFATFLMEDPNIGFHPVLDLGFDVLDFLQPGLSLSSPDSEIAAAWKAWREAILSEHGTCVSDRRNWENRARELGCQIAASTSRDAPSDVYVPFAREIVKSPELLQAIGTALANWDGEPIVGLRQIQLLQEALFNRTENSK
jgi:hypothetical protein